MNRTFRIGLLIGVSALASLRSAPAWACGGGGVASRLGVTTNAQRVFMSVRASGRTEIVAQITVPQTTADYGVLIPVPDQPTLDSEPVSAADMNMLDTLTTPVISSQTHSGGSGCGCMGAGAAVDGKGGPSKRGVTASDQVMIGPVVAVSLTGDSGEAVRAWLADNGFSLPESDATTLDRYVGAGKYFIAIRRGERAVSGGPTSIGIHYSMAGDHRMLSLGFTRIGAAPQLAITLFLAAPQTIGPSDPFKALTLDELDATTQRLDDYSLAVETAVAARDSKAFVLESATPSSTIASSIPSLSRFIDGNATITRATTVVSRERISDDVVFGTPFAGAVPSQRRVSLEAEHVRYAGMGSLPLLLMASALRRRSRGRK